MGYNQIFTQDWVRIISVSRIRSSSMWPWQKWLPAAISLIMLDRFLQIPHTCHPVNQTKFFGVFFTEVDAVAIWSIWNFSLWILPVLNVANTSRTAQHAWPRNGWRTSMEDAHLILLAKDYGVFGVFDGHGGGPALEKCVEVGHGMACPQAKCYRNIWITTFYFTRKTISQLWTLHMFVNVNWLNGKMGMTES